MNRWKLLALCALPLAAAAACHREPPPPPPPVLTPAEQVCVDRTIATTGAAPESVTIISTGSSKVGEAIFTSSVGNVDFTCVVGMDGSITTFTQTTETIVQ